METVILVIHLMIAAALVAVVLLQRSEGGALGMGGGGGGGGFMSGRGTANMLTKLTALLAAGFFLTSIVLTIMARKQIKPTSILDGGQIEAPVSGTNDGKSSLPSFGGKKIDLGTQRKPVAPSGPQVPKSQ